RGRLRGSVRLGEPEVVELADGRVARVAKLRVDRDVVGTNPFGGLSPRELEHRLAPGPEVLALGPAAQPALERVAVRIDEARDLDNGRQLDEDTTPCCGASWSWGLQWHASACLRLRMPETSPSSTTRGTAHRARTVPGSSGARTATGRRSICTRA